MISSSAQNNWDTSYTLQLSRFHATDRSTFQSPTRPETKKLIISHLTMKILINKNNCSRSWLLCFAWMTMARCYQSRTRNDSIPSRSFIQIVAISLKMSTSFFKPDLVCKDLYLMNKSYESEGKVCQGYEVLFKKVKAVSQIILPPA